MASPLRTIIYRGYQILSGTSYFAHEPGKQAHSQESKNCILYFVTNGSLKWPQINSLSKSSLGNKAEHMVAVFNVPDRKHSCRHTTLSEISNRIVGGKISTRY